MATSIPLVKDETYFMESVVFQVENCLFKVPKYQFETNSEIFASTFLLPTGNNKPEGSEEAVPFKLDGISASDFRNFLAALYPLSYAPELSMDQWVSILKLSTMWMFLDLRRTAITKLLSFPKTPQTVLLGDTYHSVELFRAGCSALASRSVPPSDEEAMMLGYETAFRLCLLREKAFKSRVQAPLIPTFEKQLNAIAKAEAEYDRPEPSSQPKQSGRKPDQ